MNFKSHKCVLRDPNCSVGNFDVTKYESVKLLFEKYQPEKTHKLTKEMDFRGFRFAMNSFEFNFDEDNNLYIELLVANPNINGLKVVILINYDSDDEDAITEADELLFELKLMGEIENGE